MKAGLLAIVALSAAASAQPHRRHQQLHEQLHAKRDVVVETAYQTQVEYATVTAPAAVVYVDQNGKPISEAEPSSEPAPAPAPAASSAAPPAPAAHVAAAAAAHWGGNGGAIHEQTQGDQPAATTEAPPAPIYTAPAAPSVAAPAPESQQPAYTPPAYTPPAAQPSATAAAPAPPSSGGDSGLGITYSPYNADNSCKSADQVKQDIAGLQGGQKLIRLYGADCNQIANVIAALPQGYKLFLGIYDITSVGPSIPGSELATLISAVKGNWGIVDTVAVGNEGIQMNKYSIEAVRIAVAAVKTALTLVGYTGPVVTVDTFTAIADNPDLCSVGDYVAANCHAYFDGGVTSDQAGQFVLSQAQRVSGVCGGKKVVISESGWPSHGSSNQKANASPDDQKAAIASLKNAFSSNLILFNSYNDGWKDPGSLGVERFWGIFGDAPA